MWDQTFAVVALLCLLMQFYTHAKAWSYYGHLWLVDMTHVVGLYVNDKRHEPVCCYVFTSNMQTAQVVSNIRRMRDNCPTSLSATRVKLISQE